VGVACQGICLCDTDQGFSVRMMVRPGELCVIQRGMKFKVILPDGPSRGCEWFPSFLWRTFLISLPSDIQEIFGSHLELPELGALGGNGLANRRDFETPVACFDIDQSPWEVVYKSVRFLPRQGSQY
jgi:homogentisate 1,2-dioxygenase